MKKIIHLLSILLLIGWGQNLQSQSLATLDYLTHSNCNEDPIGTIGIIPIGSNYNFAWIGPNSFSSSSQNLSNLIPGTYSVTVTEPGGQTSSQDFQILKLEGTETFTIIACESQCSLWQNPLPCETGTYETYFSTNNGCDSIISTEIIILPDPVTDLGTIGICGGDCINIAANEYCDPGNYSVIFLSSMGCDSIVLFEISILQTDLIQNITPDTVLCDPANFQLEVIAPNAVSYEWSPPVNLSCFDCPNPVAFPISNEFFTVIVTDDNGCTDEASVYLEVPFGLDWGLFPWSNSPVCEGGDLLFMPQIPNNIIAWEWVGPNGFSSNLENPIIPNVSTIDAGIYSVTVTDVSGCTGMAEFDVIVSDAPIADAGIDAFLNCVTPSVILDASGSSAGANFTYQWTGPNNFSSNLLNPIVFESGIYTLTIIDANTGCIAVDDVEVIASIDIPQIVVDVPEFCIEGTVDLCATVTGGSGDFQYDWSLSGGNISTDQCFQLTNFESSQIGDYEVTVSDLQTGCTTTEIFTIAPADCVWAGDTDTNKIVNNFDLLNIGLAFDATGPIRANASTNWEGQLADDWTESTPDDINYKHVDCDGNGVVNADDTLAITQNWGLTHNLWAADDRDMGAPFYVERDTFVQDTTYAIPVILGEEDFPAEAVYGVAFTLVFDTSIVASNASINFENSWLGGINNNMIAIQQTTLYTQGGRIDAGITRIDGQNMTGFGQVGTFFITIEDIIFQAPPGSDLFDIEKELIFKIEHVKMIGYDGEVIAVDTEPQPSISTSTNSAILNSQIQVFPNPTSDVLNIYSPNILMEKVEIFNIAGQRVLSNFENTNQLTLNTNNWLTGTYFIKIQTKEGVILKRAIK